MKTRRRPADSAEAADAMDRPKDTADSPVDRLARQIDALGRVVETGMDRARALRDRAEALPDSQPKQVIDICEEFVRVSREVRKTLELQHKLQMHIEDRRPARPETAPAPTVDPYFGERPTLH